MGSPHINGRSPKNDLAAPDPSFRRFYGHVDFFDSFASGRVLQHLESADETMFLPVSVKESLGHELV